jgi:hypothetical protein
MLVCCKQLVAQLEQHACIFFMQGGTVREAVDAYCHLSALALEAGKVSGTAQSSQSAVLVSFVMYSSTGAIF